MAEDRTPPPLPHQMLTQPNFEPDQERQQRLLPGRQRAQATSPEPQVSQPEQLASGTLSQIGATQFPRGDSQSPDGADQWVSVAETNNLKVIHSGVEDDSEQVKTVLDASGDPDGPEADDLTDGSVTLVHRLSNL